MIKFKDGFIISGYKNRNERKRQEYYMAFIRTVAPFIQIALTLYLIWRVQ